MTAEYEKWAKLGEDPDLKKLYDRWDAAFPHWPAVADAALLINKPYLCLTIKDQKAVEGGHANGLLGVPDLFLMEHDPEGIQTEGWRVIRPDGRYVMFFGWREGVRVPPGIKPCRVCRIVDVEVGEI